MVMLKEHFTVSGICSSCGLVGRVVGLMHVILLDMLRFETCVYRCLFACTDGFDRNQVSAKDATCKQGYKALECCKFIESTLCSVIRR
jgi:hypothetical protein